MNAISLFDAQLRRARNKAFSFRERHRHRWEFNNAYREVLAQNGLNASGTSPDGALVEISEISQHPFMLGTQFHPEFLSRPQRPHPLFRAFVAAVHDAIGPASAAGSVRGEDANHGSQGIDP